MTVVRYAEYRRLEAQRRDANNAMMALLAGSKLAVNTLGLTDGSHLTLAQIFPKVPHIQRFNLRADDARSLLDDAEHHLATMAVPYVLALHEDYMSHCAAMLVASGWMTAKQRRDLSPKTMHEKVAQKASGAFSVPSLELFHLLRTLRNCQIHEGGRVNTECHGVRAALSSQAESLWQHLTKEAVPACFVGDAVRLAQPQLVGALAVTNQLMEEGNEMLQPVVSSQTWLRLAISDAATSGTGTRGNPAQRLRALRGFVRMHYGPIGLTVDGVEAEARAQGLL